LSLSFIPVPVDWFGILFYRKERTFRVPIEVPRVEWLTVGANMTSSILSKAFLVADKTSPNNLSLREMKANQTRKIEELRKALCAAGPISICQQSESLGLCRSTAWAVLKRPYKNSGLTAAIINRMLTSPKLPPRARIILAEYVEEKASGLYGHRRAQRLRFTATLSNGVERRGGRHLSSHTLTRAGFVDGAVAET
jgi:hypothetical protein